MGLFTSLLEREFLEQEDGTTVWYPTGPSDQGYELNPWERRAISTFHAFGIWIIGAFLVMPWNWLELDAAGNLGLLGALLVLLTAANASWFLAVSWPRRLALKCTKRDSVFRQIDKQRLESKNREHSPLPVIAPFLLFFGLAFSVHLSRAVLG